MNKINKSKDDVKNQVFSDIMLGLTQEIVVLERMIKRNKDMLRQMEQEGHTLMNPSVDNEIYGIPHPLEPDIAE